MARRKLLNKKMIDNIAAAVSIGATYEIAAAYAGVSESSLAHWLAIGRQEQDKKDANEAVLPENSIYLQLLQSVEKAKGELGIELLQEVQEARRAKDINSTWRLLGVRFGYTPERKVDVTSGGAALTFVISKDTDTDDRDTNPAA